MGSRLLVAAVVAVGFAVAAVSCSSPTGPTCAASAMVCDGRCVDVTASNTDCGACGNSCAAGLTCVSGACSLVCAADQTACAGACVSTARDPANCGACGVSCAKGLACSGGQCVASCPSGELDCNGSCIDPLTDRAHCGAAAGCSGATAGTACAAGEVCSAGACALSCPVGTLKCGNRCVDPQTDRAFCGAAADCAGANDGTACAAGQICSGGVCALSCQQGLIDCGGKCIDPLVDPVHCGATGTCTGATAGAACVNGQVCSTGTCALMCQAGLVLCNGRCVDPLTDRTFCGASGNCAGADAGEACPPGEVCSAGSCALSCQSGLLNCAGKCVDPLTDRAHCGATGSCTGASAGAVCPAGQLCSAGTCALSCQSGLVECAGKCVDPQTDRTFCGASGNCQGADAGTSCASGQICSSGACVLSCASGSLVCSGKCIDPLTDRSFCGASGNCTGAAAGAACAAGQVCSQGQCALNCGGGTSACDGGCVDTAVDPSNCGACGTACPAGRLCKSGSCASLGNGVPCSGVGDCASGSCVDGVCCDAACSGLCSACTAAKKGSGSDGACGFITGGADPDSECAGATSCSGTGTCAALANGQSCGADIDCVSGFCRDGVCCGTACTGACSACSSSLKGSGADGTCGPIAAGTDPENECAGAQVCNGAAACRLPDGQACSVSSECLSGICRDGVCCGSVCSATCQACTAAKKGSGVDGTCGLIAANLDPDDECSGAEVCNGAGGCDLPNGAACTLDTSCVSGFCRDGVCCNASCTGVCNACTAVKKGSGADGTCGPIASSTDPDNECTGTTTCNGASACNRLANGSACTLNGECTSNACVDGFCCATACSGTCQACSTAKKGSGSNGVCGSIASNTDPDDECSGTAVCNGAGACAVQLTVTSGTPGTYPPTQNGGGVISSSPGSMLCSAGQTCSASFASGSTVTLNASPDSTSTFTSWTGCDSVSGSVCTVTMTADRSVTATFTRQYSTLSVALAGVGTGVITSSAVTGTTAINCSEADSSAASCSEAYVRNTSVTLTATPIQDSVFAGWSPGCASISGNTCTVFMDASKSLTASFNPNCSNSGGASTCGAATTVSLNQSPVSGTIYQFVDSDWFRVDFGGCGFGAPRIFLSANPNNEFRFDMFTVCGGSSPPSSCWSGGVSDATDTSYTCGATCTAATAPGIVLIRVYRTQPARTCAAYTLSVTR